MSSRGLVSKVVSSLSNCQNPAHNRIKIGRPLLQRIWIRNWSKVLHSLRWGSRDMYIIAIKCKIRSIINNMLHYKCIIYCKEGNIWCLKHLVHLRFVYWMVRCYRRRKQDCFNKWLCNVTEQYDAHVAAWHFVPKREYAALYWTSTQRISRIGRKSNT